MSNVVQFLETLSLDPKAVTEEQYVQAVSTANFNLDVTVALLKRDVTGLNRLLGGRATVLAFVFPAENEPDDNQRDDDTPPDESEKEVPQNDQNSAQAA